MKAEIQVIYQCALCGYSEGSSISPADIKNPPDEVCPKCGDGKK